MLADLKQLKIAYIIMKCVNILNKKLNGNVFQQQINQIQYKINNKYKIALNKLKKKLIAKLVQ